MTRKAVYAGSFDPITNGHLWMIEQGARMFDELVVAIGVNPDKKYTFTLEERVRVLQDAVRGLERVTVDQFENQFLANYARDIGAEFILRGIRDSRDFEFERGMRHVNQDLQPGLATVFLMPPRAISEVSSSLVKGLIGPRGWREIVRGYVPPAVYELILTRYGSR